MTRMDFATSAGLPDTLQELLRRGHPLQQILPSMTSNVARLLRLPGKGRIAAGCDADLLVLGESGEVRHVMANGRWMVQDGVPVQHGTFERGAVTGPMQAD
jgi:beta-aspartyl-dipeptidase (metallo-type)